MDSELKSPYKISLDFYIRKIITVNAKQLDTNSRIINITCTDNGKKVVLNSSTTSAFVRYKKSDGYAVLNELEILDNGTVNLELSQQMLAVEGRQIVDIMLVNGTELTIETVENILNSETMDGISVLSTMSFYINTEGCTIDGVDIESSYEYNAMIDGLGKMIAVDQRLVQVESNANEAIQKCNTATDNANKVITNADKATNDANNAAQNANKATSSANNAATNATNAGDKCEKIVEKYETLDFEKIDEILDYKVEITQEEYKALSEEEKKNGKIYFITDVNEGGTASEVFYNNSKSGLTSANVQNAIDDVCEKKLEKNSVVNNLTTTEDGYALDARQGKVLKDEITQLNNNLEQTKEGQFVLPNGLKICWGQDTLDYGNEYVAHGTIYFPFHYQKPPIVIASKLLLNPNISNGWLDIQTICSHRSVSNVSFSAGIYCSVGSFNQEEENYKWFAVSWIAIGY